MTYKTNRYWITAKLLLLLRDRISNVGSPRRTCPNQFIALLNTYHSNAMGICVFVKTQFFRNFFPQIVTKLSPLQQLSSYVFLSRHYASSSSQNARTGQICCLFLTSKVWKVFKLFTLIKLFTCSLLTNSDRFQVTCSVNACIFSISLLLLT